MVNRGVVLSLSFVCWGSFAAQAADQLAASSQGSLEAVAQQTLIVVNDAVHHLVTVEEPGASLAPPVPCSDSADTTDPPHLVTERFECNGCIAVQGRHACAITSSGRVGCWGYMKLPDHPYIPFVVAEIRLFTPPRSLATNQHAVCILPARWPAMCKCSFGVNDSSCVTPDHWVYGQEVALGSDHYCITTRVATNVFRIACKGSNTHGQTTIPPPLKHISILDVCAGEQFSCAITADHRAVCWGRNDWGQADVPAELLYYSIVASVSCGSRHACVLTLHGEVMCWGDNRGGQVDPVPQEFQSGVVQVAAGESATCALKMTGGVGCWGRNSAFLGIGGITSDAVWLGVGEGVACVVAANGTLSCLGDEDIMWIPKEFRNLNGGERQEQMLPL